MKASGKHVNTHKGIDEKVVKKAINKVKFGKAAGVKGGITVEK